MTKEYACIFVPAGTGTNMPTRSKRLTSSSDRAAAEGFLSDLDPVTGGVIVVGEEDGLTTSLKPESIRVYRVAVTTTHVMT